MRRGAVSGLSHSTTGDIILTMKKESVYSAKLVAHINRKHWWHVPPQDASAYASRGKFLASSFAEAEFWGRPLDQPEKVTISSPLIGDEKTIEKKLFGRRASHAEITMEERWALDEKMRIAALSKGFDSIVLIAPKAFAELRATGKLPRRIELNILQP